MIASNAPGKFSIPWGNSAGSSYIRSVPVASQIGISGGAASLTDGFPPVCFEPVAAGGVPPWGQDMNGILRQITQWNQWQQAGGPIVYDSAFQSSIGGYPMGALIQLSAGGPSFVSTVDNNTVAPAVGASGWMPAPSFGGNITAISATGALTAYNAGLVLVNAASGNINITMPAVASESNTKLPFHFVRVDSSANTVTLTRAGSDTFFPGGASTFALASNTAAQFDGNGASAWCLIGGNFFAASNTWTGGNTFNAGLTVPNNVSYQLTSTVGVFSAFYCSPTNVVYVGNNTVPLMLQSSNGGNVFGIGQSQQTVSRSYNTNYTNTTNAPIMVSCATSSTGTGSVGIYIGGVEVTNSTTTSSGVALCVWAIVPSGAVYQFATTGSISGTATFTEWR